MYFYLDYKELLNTAKVIGTWDDHDYGVNNGDRTFYRKIEYRDYYLDFIQEPLDSERRLEKDKGLHH
jgi:alkaline phosphatase D